MTSLNINYREFNIMVKILSCKEAAEYGKPYVIFIQASKVGEIVNSDNKSSDDITLVNDMVTNFVYRLLNGQYDNNWLMGMNKEVLC